VNGARFAPSAFAFQLSVLRRSPGDLMVLVNTPLLTVAFVAIADNAGRSDLHNYVVLAPAVMALWSMAVLVSGEIVDRERGYGTLELLIASPASIAGVLAGRITAVTLVSLLALAEAWLVAWLGFGILVPITHPGVFLLALLATALATAGWATAMSAIFVLARSARIFQNGINYPFFVLGGALVPVEFLPDWLRPLSAAVYLSWANDLLRDSTGAGEVTGLGLRFGMLLGLGAAGFVLGGVLLKRAVDRVRRTGAVTYA
jgi:ABC-2 type transport system permease protein